MAGERDNSGVRFPPPLLYVVGLLAGWLLERRLPFGIAFGNAEVHSTIILPSPAARIAGWALVAIGLTFMFVSVGLFRRAGTSLVPVRPTTAIVTTGFYRFTRNPMYLGMAIVYLGITVLMRSWWPLLFFPVVLLSVDRLVIAKEERYLAGKFGETYLAYKNRVRRWI